MSNNNKIPGMSEKEILSIGVENKELSNDDCFSILYDTYADKVLGFIMAHNYSKAEGEKILVNVFITVWENSRAYDEGRKNKLCMILGIAAKLINKQKQIRYSFKAQNMDDLTPDKIEIYFKPGYA